MTSKFSQIVRKHEQLFNRFVETPSALLKDLVGSFSDIVFSLNSGKLNASYEDEEAVIKFFELFSIDAAMLIRTKNEKSPIFDWQPLEKSIAVVVAGLIDFRCAQWVNKKTVDKEKDFLLYEKVGMVLGRSACISAISLGKFGLKETRLERLNRSVEGSFAGLFKATKLTSNDVHRNDKELGNYISMANGALCAGFSLGLSNEVFDRKDEASDEAVGTLISYANANKFHKTSKAFKKIESVLTLYGKSDPLQWLRAWGFIKCTSIDDVEKASKAINTKNKLITKDELIRLVDAANLSKKVEKMHGQHHASFKCLELWAEKEKLMSETGKNEAQHTLLKRKIAL
jgi:hypothetical protein